ncbi:MAG: hypothetical protein ACYDCO_23290 [Armatimonadota bacterium]
MYASIRRYNVTAKDEVIRRTNEGFVPLISRQQGFIAYFCVDAGDGAWATVSIFQNQEGAEHSNQMAADWVRQNTAELVQGAVDVTAGEVVIQVWPEKGVQERAA